jgi:intracellular septation protein
MLSLFYDLVPVVLFFIAFKFYGIYVATVVGIVVTALQVLVSTLWFRKIDKKQMITLVIFILFGGLTLYLHNPIFIKWKPTVIYWIFGAVFLGSHFIGNKTLIERLFASTLENNDNPMKNIPVAVWRNLNIAWIIFFILLGGINLCVAYQFSTNAWVNFKLYGVMGSLLGFSIVQALYLTRYITDKK